MIEIEVNQDIREYKTKLIGPFTTRQVICLILGGTTVIGAYNLLQPYLTSDTTTFVCMILAVPFILMSGIFEPHGMKMEDFLKDVYTSIYKKWILFQQIDNCQIMLSSKDQNKIILETKYGVANVIFYKFNIIELNVIGKIDQESCFFLHFQMNNINHAINLFYEMVECLKTLIKKPKIKILLCCSGGLTTTYFAYKIDEAIQLFALDYEIAATGYNELFKKGEQYDVILLAPQVSFMYAKVKKIFKDKYLLNIPAQVFAKYDVKEILNLVDQELIKKRNKNGQVQLLSIRNKTITFHRKILCISLFRNRNRIHIAYRLYQSQSDIIVNNETIKQRITIQDIYDVIDTVLLNYPGIEVIGFSTPGIVNNGFATTASINGFDDMNYKKLFTSKYSQKFIITNDVNTAAIGYHATQNQYSSIVLLFQPMSTKAGAGIIIDNKLINGKHNVAGEMKYLPVNLLEKGANVYKTPEDIIKIVKYISLSIISVIGPEAIVIFCSLLPNIEDLENELKTVLPQEYIPRLIKIDDIQEYIFLGQTIICT